MALRGGERAAPILKTEFGSCGCSGVIKLGGYLKGRGTRIKKKKIVLNNLCKAKGFLNLQMYSSGGQKFYFLSPCSNCGGGAKQGFRSQI